LDLLKILKERDLPALKSRDEMIKILLDEEYGHLPSTEYKVSVSEPKVIERRYHVGTAVHSQVNMTVSSAYGEHTFTVNRVLHTDGKKRPFFVLLNFSSAVPDKYYPTEEIAENDFDVLSVWHNDITSDDGDFKNGLAGVLLENGQSDERTCGKIMIWAFAASRILDYAETLPCLDMSEAAVIGHSRLGKTALVAGMLDTRFKYAISNDSGCSGAAICRGNLGVVGKTGAGGKTGETIRDIVKNFPFWFCKKYASYVNTCVPDGFDQHYLLASVAPRHVYVASALYDDWADPDSELLSCVAATPAYEAQGCAGLVCGGYPETCEALQEGNIGYHRSNSYHFLSRHDWNNYMKYINRHKGK